MHLQLHLQCCPSPTVSFDKFVNVGADLTFLHSTLYLQFAIAQSVFYAGNKRSWTKVSSEFKTQIE